MCDSVPSKPFIGSIVYRSKCKTQLPNSILQKSAVILSYQQNPKHVCGAMGVGVVRRLETRLLTTSRNSAFICLSSTTRLAETAVAFEFGPLAVATRISVSKSCHQDAKTYLTRLDP